jgi:hypothetical protein
VRGRKPCAGSLRKSLAESLIEVRIPEEVQKGSDSNHFAMSCSVPKEHCAATGITDYFILPPGHLFSMLELVSLVGRKKVSALSENEFSGV